MTKPIIPNTRKTIKPKGFQISLNPSFALRNPLVIDPVRDSQNKTKKNNTNRYQFSITHRTNLAMSDYPQKYQCKQCYDCKYNCSFWFFKYFPFIRNKR